MEYIAYILMEIKKNNQNKKKTLFNDLNSTSKGLFSTKKGSATIFLKSVETE